MNYKKITIELGYWDDHPLFSQDEGAWRQWVRDVTHAQVMAYGKGPQYGVEVEEFDFKEDN